jgi:hypothetical protein
MERFKKERAAVAPGRFQYSFWVTGRGSFPYDMLRYDKAFPVDSEAASRLEPEMSREGARKLRSIHLMSYQEPTVERWQSFVWTVGIREFKE